MDQAHTLVQYWYSGTEGGTALAQMLFGDVNPSGKLPVTFPKALEDTPTARFGEFPGDDTVHYWEGIYVGYRYYDTFDVEPEFCFGHGLSYTDFSYHDLHVNISKNEQNEPIVNVALSLTNTGSVAGAEVAQLYVSDPECTVDRPKKELKQFAKVFLQPGETKEISMQLSKKAFCFYSILDSDWKFESGDFLVQIGSSSRDLRLTQRLTL